MNVLDPRERTQPLTSILGEIEICEEPAIASQYAAAGNLNDVGKPRREVYEGFDITQWGPLTVAASVPPLYISVAVGRGGAIVVRDVNPLLVKAMIDVLVRTEEETLRP